MTKVRTSAIMIIVDEREVGIVTKQEIKRREFLLAKIWWDKPTKTEIKEFEKLDKKFHKKS